MNINDRAKVKLTERGLKVFMHYAETTATACKMTKQQVMSTCGYVESDRSLEVAMWDLMYIFGQAHYMGSAPCFVDNHVIERLHDKIVVLDFKSGIGKARCQA